MSTEISLRASCRPKIKKLTKAEQAAIASRNKLVEQHLEWAWRIAASVADGLPTWFRVDDLRGPAEIGLIQAASRYDPAKNDNFRAYAKQRVYGACIASIRRREYKERSHLELEDTHSHPDAGPDAKAQVEIARQQVRRYVAELPPANARVLRAYYFQELTLVEIASRMNISESWVYRLHREGLQMLHARCAPLKDLAA